MKYRAWHKGHWVTDRVAILPDGEILIFDSNAGEGLELVFRYSDSDTFKTHYWKDVVIERYVEMEDRAGKNVFEGDIVKVHVFTQELGENLGVTEGEREFVAQIMFGTVGVVLARKSDEDSGPIWAYNGFHEESLEIIGNIHENPELLEEK